MLKLNKDYYLAIDERRLVGRFVRLQDAIEALPTGNDCFGPNIQFKMGKVYRICEENPDLFKPNKTVNVFESLEEFNLYKNDEQNLRL